MTSSYWYFLLLRRYSPAQPG